MRASRTYIIAAVVFAAPALTAGEAWCWWADLGYAAIERASTPHYDATYLQVVHYGNTHLFIVNRAIDLLSAASMPGDATAAAAFARMDDRRCRRDWQQGLLDADFSPSLMEADLMRRVLPASEFRDWFGRFLPGAARGRPRKLLEPATVSDRSDPQIVHLDGLNLSRAWCMRSIAAALPKDDPARKALAESAARHAEAGLKHVASGDYAGEHWLASFAVYMLSTPSPD